jgi:hypothetical protein
MDAKVLEQEINDWMRDNETDLFDLIRETTQEFEGSHPGLDTMMIRINALSMADRRFMARAFAEVVSKYLK